MNAAFTWSPFLPPAWIAALAAACAVLLLLGFLRGARDLAWRALFCAVLALLVMNPAVLHETRQALPDKLVILVDESPSQKIAGRNAAAEAALVHLLKTLERTPGVEPVVLRVSGDGESTNLFAALSDAMPAWPLKQLAGAVLITDGQVHDAPFAPGVFAGLAPVHAVLTGRKNETDRKVTVISAPRYGLLESDVTVTVRVDAFGAAAGEAVTLSATQDGKPAGVVTLLPGEAHAFTFRLGHAGQNVFEFSAPAAEGELTAANNAAPVIVNGVRDRLRVLLVSGAPHMGERAWRNLLKSDPSIDLVHFTILRSLDAADPTPQRDLALIAFPVDELFRRRLSDFDLIIFDRYSQFSLLTPLYFGNIARFVRAGGAFLLAMGSDADSANIFETELEGLLPVAPGGAPLRGAFRPQLTPGGAAHPVTGDLPRVQDPATWGQWFTQASVRGKEGGKTLMTGLDGSPLLVLGTAGEGRVAVLSGDNVWLWSRGAGPYGALLRNTAHWLMKEPELEEDHVRATVQGSVITVSRRAATAGAADGVTMTTPDGMEKTVVLDAPEEGWMTAQVTAARNGIYGFSAVPGGRKTFVAVGAGAGVEFSAVQATAEKLTPLAGKTGGRIIWYHDDPDFTISPRRNAAYAVTRAESRALVPNALSLLAILVGTLFVWWRESGAGRQF